MFTIIIDLNLPTMKLYVLCSSFGEVCVNCPSVCSELDSYLIILASHTGLRQTI